MPRKDRGRSTATREKIGPVADLSVILACKAVGLVTGCLETLRQECRSDQRLEIIVAGTEDLLSSLRGSLPGAIFVSLPRNTPIAVIRAAALRAATGQYIATITPTTRLLPGWLATVREALLEHPVVGGAVEPAVTGWGAQAWAGFWCEYGHYLPPVRGGLVRDLSGNNIAFHRDVLEATGALSDGAEGFWKATALRRLRATGVPLWMEPSLVVGHEWAWAFGPFLRRRFHHGRCYAASRAADEPERRWRRVVAAPLLPALFLARLYVDVWPKGRYRRELLLATPLLLALYAMWALGEGAGAILRGGDSCARAY